VQREHSEAVRRWSGTVAKVVCVTIPGLQLTTRLRLALRCARDTPLILAPMGLTPGSIRFARRVLRTRWFAGFKPGNDGEETVPANLAARRAPL